MAYSGYASRINSAISNLNGKVDGIDNINFDSSWEGNAHTSQMSHRDDLSSSMKNVISDMESLVTALQEIDNYDTLKTQCEKWEGELYSLPADETEKRENASRNLAEVRGRLTESKKIIDDALGAISTTYNSSLSLIEKTTLVSTNDTFINVFTAKSNISSSFEISQYVSVTSPFTADPDFTNREAWVTENPYSQAGLYGQCTWFAWGKFYEAYGYSPGFTGNGNMCAKQLVATHPDKFELSKTPITGAVFSYLGQPYGHTGFVTEVKDGMMTIQDGNYDGVTNTFAVAQKDWGTRTISVQDFINRYGGNVVFANPIK